MLIGWYIMFKDYLKWKKGTKEAMGKFKTDQLYLVEHSLFTRSDDGRFVHSRCSYVNHLIVCPATEKEIKSSLSTNNKFLKNHGIYKNFKFYKAPSKDGMILPVLSNRIILSYMDSYGGQIKCGIYDGVLDDLKPFSLYLQTSNLKDIPEYLDLEQIKDYEFRINKKYLEQELED